EKEKTDSKKCKNRTVQVETCTEQKMNDLNVRVPGFKGTPERDPVSNSEEVLKSFFLRVLLRVRKTKRKALRQGSPNQKQDMSWKPEEKPEQMLSESGLKTKASDAKQCETKVMSREDLLVPSAGHQQEQTVFLKRNLISSKHSQLASKASQQVVDKVQAAKQKLPKDSIPKRQVESPRKKLKKSGKKSSNTKPHFQRKKGSDSELGEEELEREPVKLNEVLTSPPHQELQNSVIEKLDKSERPENILHALKSLDGTSNKSLVKALQYLIDSVRKSEKKQLSTESVGKRHKKIHCRNSEGVCSNPEDAKSQMDSDSSFIQDVAKKKQKKSDVKIKSNKRKHNTQHGLHGPVLEHCRELSSGSESREQDDTFSDSSEDQVRHLLADNNARHKIVMPTHTPNVRRTKRIRVRPLDYWRGERVNYKMRPSGNLVVSGIVCPESEPPREKKPRKGYHKQKTDEARREIPANLNCTLADTSKPTVVVDPVTNKEVLLTCVNTDDSKAYFFKDESVEIYKNLNTSTFAIGKLILKPLKEKGQQCVYMDTIVFHVIWGKVIFTLHKTSYYLTTGDFFCVPEGNMYNIRNLLNQDSILVFTQLR
ncbi:Centromere protein C, partial [Colius striatus]